LERIVIEAALLPEGRELWLREAVLVEHFTSHAGRRLAEAILPTLAAQIGDLNPWLEAIKDAKAREVLEMEWMLLESEPSLDEVPGAIERLRSLTDRRRVSELSAVARSDDEALRLLNERLRRQHELEGEEPEEPEDPFA
jgi:hypothetical protein